ncbi:MAG: hypothetical protein ACYCVD_16765 [Desulfitobacteriaceae bacterium]
MTLNNIVEELLSLTDSQSIHYIRPGDIVLLSGSGWIDRTINRITQSIYSHAAGVIKPYEVIDILPFKKAGYKKLNQYTGRVDIFTCDLLTDTQRNIIIEYVNKKVGVSYDYFLLFWQASRYLLHWIWNYKKSRRIICSTLWAEAYREVEVELCPGIKYPSPGDLANSTLLRRVLSY